MVHDRYSDNRVQQRVVRERTCIHRLPGPTSSDSGVGLSLMVGSSRSLLIVWATIEKGHIVGASSSTNPFPARGLMMSCIRAL
jgi:hypothetical protein